MLKTTAVFVTLIIVGGCVALGLLGVIGFLVYEGKNAADILTLVNLLVSGAALGKAYRVGATVDKVDAQTNGVNTRLMDHALGKP